MQIIHWNEIARNYFAYFSNSEFLSGRFDLRWVSRFWVGWARFHIEKKNFGSYWKPFAVQAIAIFSYRNWTSKTKILINGKARFLHHKILLSWRETSVAGIKPSCSSWTKVFPLHVTCAITHYFQFSLATMLIRVNNWRDFKDCINGRGDGVKALNESYG